MSIQLTLPVQLRTDITFANFYPGSNQTVIEYLQAFINTNEFYTYIWGQTGVGCSHLLQACYQQAHEQQIPAFYLSLLEASKISPDMFENFETAKLVCLDDMQAIAGNRVWEEAIFHLYNRLQMNSGHLLIAGNTPPAGLDIKLPDLASRLSSGSVFQIQALDDSAKLAALQLRAQQCGLTLPPETGQYLLARFPRDLATLFAVLEKLDQASLAAQRRLTIPFAKLVLAESQI